ncbi:MAG: hypothetical protein V4615_04505 [Bacteroidota bacterium]
MKSAPYIILFLLFFEIVGCKKDTSCHRMKANLNGVTTDFGCLYIGDLDTNYYTLSTFAPNQQQNEKYDVLLHFKKQFGTQQLDTATNNLLAGSFFIFFTDYYSTNRKQYSLYSGGTNGEITVTGIDEVGKTVQGIFSGTLSEIDSANDRIQITNASFSGVYR